MFQRCFPLLLPGLMALLVGFSAQGQPDTTHQYRIDFSLERNDGRGWFRLRLFPNGPSLRYYWLIWDPRQSAAVCVSYYIIDIAAASRQIACSWDAGANWYSRSLGRFDDGTVPIFVNELRVSPDDGQTLILTGHGRVLHLWPGEDQRLLVEEQPPLPMPPACEPLPADHVCADLVLENMAAVWFDPTQPGQGVTLIARQGRFWGVFTRYDSQGDPHWYLFEALHDQMNPYIRTDLLEFTGPPMGSEWDPALVQGTPVGEVSMSLLTPHQIRFSYEIPDERGSLELVAFDLYQPSPILPRDPVRRP